MTDTISSNGIAYAQKRIESICYRINQRNKTIRLATKGVNNRMKIEFTLLEDEATMVQAVFNFHKMNNAVQQNEQAKKLLFDWDQKWLYEMARKTKDKSGMHD